MKPMIHRPEEETLHGKYLQNYTKFVDATITKSAFTQDGIIDLYFALDGDVRNQFCRQHNFTYVLGNQISKCNSKRRVHIQVSLLSEKVIEDAIKVMVDIDALPHVSN